MSAQMSEAIDPHLGELLANLSAGRASGLRLRDGVLTLVLEVGGLDAAARGQLEETMKAAALGVQGVREVKVAMTAEKAVAPRIVVVGSGKGGVGKSTLSANLAVALKALGKRVGMVDADIQGPSLPRLLASEGVKPRAEGNKLIPVPNSFGIPMLSMGHLVQPGQAIAWRGPMVGNALGQLIDADWRGVDLLVVDLPPGTGDVQLTMIQRYKPAGAVIVSTPQDLALIDAARAVSFFEQAQVPIIGMVENMAGYVCPHCGEVSDPFGTGGAEAEARDLGLAFLGRVPLDIAIRTASDAGTPPAAGTDIVGLPFRAIAERVSRWLDNQGPGNPGAGVRLG
jgi:ATP-binding protein involved in chromosome partitioning